MAIDPSQFRDHIRGTRAPRTAETYSKIASDFAAFVEANGSGARPDRRHVERFLARPRKNGAARSAATRNQELAALRAFAAFATRHTGWTIDPTDGIAFAREPDRDPAVLTRGELRVLFEAAHNKEGAPALRARDVAIVALLSQAGLRVHELVALDVDQVDLETRTLVAVRGKGGSVHDIPLNTETAALVERWLEDRLRLARPMESALLVCSRGTRLSIRGVERLIAGLRTSITKKKLTPHTLRHTAATLALVLGCDVATVGDLLRHSSLDTTRGYLHLIDERKRDAVSRLGTLIPRSVLPSPIAGNPEAGSAAAKPPRKAGSTQKQLDHQYPLNEAPAGRLSPRDSQNSLELRDHREPPEWPFAA